MTFLCHLLRCWHTTFHICFSLIRCIQSFIAMSFLALCFISLSSTVEHSSCAMHWCNFNIHPISFELRNCLSVCIRIYPLFLVHHLYNFKILIKLFTKSVIACFAGTLILFSSIFFAYSRTNVLHSCNINLFFIKDVA